MKHWMLWLLAGIVALIGGLAALFNLGSASSLTLTLGGWALILVGALQGWAAYKAPSVPTMIGAGLLSWMIQASHTAKAPRIRRPAPI